jgi:hypothetical protein
MWLIYSLVYWLMQTTGLKSQIMQYDRIYYLTAV